MPVEAKPLFRPDVLRSHLAGFALPGHVEAVRPKLAKWATLLKGDKADKFKEQEILPDFLTDFFIGLLGYAGPAEGGERWTLSREKHVQVGGKFADAVLGDFRLAGDGKFIVAVEGKGPKDPLDRPFAGRQMSAVDQAYRYAINLPCDWIIVTSIRQTRLYHKGSDQQTYERFDTVQLAADDALLKKFLFLLGAARVVPAAGRCHLYDLQTASEKVGRELTKEYYVRYADMRQEAYEQLGRDNPDVPRPALLASTQKLLDRILFCAFCEDRGLLPAETIAKAYQHRDPYNPRPVWDNFRGLFNAINVGNETLNINGYNGGLFAADSTLDRLRVPDAVCEHFRELGAYDYRPPSEVKPDDAKAESGSLIDVDILGHIFEQSITDLEKLRDEAEGKAAPAGLEKHKSRRKKEGAFYTPAFITRYIVEQALGSVLRERFERLRQAHQQEAKGTARGALDDPDAFDLDELKKPQRDALTRFWERWQDELETVRLLDPACGSGAFLIEAFDQLHKVYQSANDRLTELRGSAGLFDPDRTILEKNLYGVDLNEEAIEICKLSLWIKTAAQGKQLTSLDHTIRVGNSVVSDSAVHPKALDWHTAFPEVFAAGGFDVVVGNPPYIRQEWLSPFKPYWERVFTSYHGVADIFTYFYEIGLQLLRPAGLLAFITSGSWVRGNFGAPLRKLLAEHANLETMIDFGEFQPFEDAEMIRPSITVIRKAPPGKDVRVFKWLTSGRPPENLSDAIAAAPTIPTDRLGAKPWELETKAVLSLRDKMALAGQSLKDYTGSQILYGIKTGLNEAFVIDKQKRAELIEKDPRSAEIIKPFVQGTHLRPWYVEQSGEFLIFTRRGIVIEDYPAVLNYLMDFRERLEPKPENWDPTGKWQGRKAGAYQWYEIQDTIDYWQGFEVPKIVWPDISKLPRFSMDEEGRFLGNTGYVIPGGDYYLLGVLSSWATWFIISKTAQPLRLRGNRWQYRLIAQFMENVPIPNATELERRTIGDLARKCCLCAMQRYESQCHVQKRLCDAFGLGKTGQVLGVLNTKAQLWWESSVNDLGNALKASFKLTGNPFKSPRVADEWEPYLDAKRREIEALGRQLAGAEAEVNLRVYRLFDLTKDEIALLEKEVEH